MKQITAFVLCLLAVPAFSGGPQYLEQNWSDEDRQWFYTTPQGSKMIPYSWGMALELPDSDAHWVTTATSYGFLPSPVSNRNPDGLPVGIVRDGRHLGLTCAACHTKQMRYKGTVYQIDGAPTDADFFGFMRGLRDAVKATAKGPFTSPKFVRFANEVLGEDASNERRQELYKDLRHFDAYYDRFITALMPTTTPWGRARGDAFANMFNRITGVDLSIPSNTAPGNAPASYPTLWDTSWQDKVEWNGAGGSRNVMERLARNVGEVLGVFGEIEIRKPSLFPPRFWYASTAHRVNLLELETTVSYLRSPKWPEDTFGPLDGKKLALGAQIYIEQCRTCHAIVTPGVLQQMTMTPLDRVGTDKDLAWVAAHREGTTGVMNGVKEFIFIGPRMGARAKSATMLTNAVTGAINSPFTLEETKTGFGRVPWTPGGAAVPETIPVVTPLAYRARPLNGIWATAPYVHNGSVPTLWDMLLPPAQRQKTFHVGNREFDPVKVGEQTTAVPGSTLLDTSLPGNRNSGHTWGTALSESDRWALIEYLKSL